MIAKYLKQTGKHSLVYGLGNLVSKIIAFILIPIYTRVLTTEEYGILSLMTITLTIVATLLSFSLHTTLFRFYTYDYSEEKDRKSLISTIIIFLFPILVIMIGLLIYFSDALSEIFFSTSDYGYYLKLIFLASFFEIGTMISLAILRAQSKSKTFSALVVLRFVVQIAAIIYFVVYLNKGIEGALKGQLYAFIFFFIVNAPIILKNVDFTFSFKKFKEIMRFSIPLVPAALATWVMTMIDRFILHRIDGSGIVGVYTLGYNIGLIISFIFVSPIQLAWAQIKWSILKNELKAKEIFSYIMTYYIMIGALIVIGLSLFAEEIIKIISTTPYYPAATIIIYVAISYLLYGIYFMINIGIDIKKKTEITALTLIICSLTNVALNFLLIPKYSMKGAAIATIIAYMLLVVLTYIFNNKYYSMRYQWSRILKIVLAAVLILFTNHFIPEVNIVTTVIYKTILMFSFLGILYLLRMFEDREIRKTFEFINVKIFKRK